MPRTKRSISVILPALTARQAEALIDALNSIVGQLWDAYGKDIRMQWDGYTDSARGREQREPDRLPIEDDPPW